MSLNGGVYTGGLPIRNRDNFEEGIEPWALIVAICGGLPLYQIGMESKIGDACLGCSTVLHFIYELGNPTWDCCGEEEPVGGWGRLKDGLRVRRKVPAALPNVIRGVRHRCETYSFHPLLKKSSKTEHCLIYRQRGQEARGTVSMLNGTASPKVGATRIPVKPSTWGRRHESDAVGLRVISWRGEFDPVFSDTYSPSKFLGPKRYTNPPRKIPEVDGVIISLRLLLDTLLKRTRQPDISVYSETKTISSRWGYFEVKHIHSTGRTTDAWRYPEVLQVVFPRSTGPVGRYLRAVVILESIAELKDKGEDGLVDANLKSAKTVIWDMEVHADVVEPGVLPRRVSACRILREKYKRSSD
ncbi:hypothetical protein EDD85DRAFT_794169 [Armillaria nabsnona]|nr:hypothetical protein EDD85DRAFT_794169 [Armillaria nabsnona]